MKVKTFQEEYELTNFSCYLDNFDGDIISVIDLVVRNNNPEQVEIDFNNLFALETDKNAHVFAGYKVSECYLVDSNLIKVVCIK